MKRYKLGYTAGVFDMFHVGHLNILARAKERCERLVVGVTTDELCFSRKNKYPIINEDDRKAIIGAIRHVDMVVDQADMDKVAMARRLGADAMFVGSDWKGTPAWERYGKELAAIGCEVVYLDHTDGISSSILRGKLAAEDNG